MASASCSGLVTVTSRAAKSTRSLSAGHHRPGAPPGGPAPPPRTFHGDLGTALGTAGLAPVDAGVGGREPQHSKLSHVALQAHSEFVRGRQGCVLLVPLHSLRGRLEVAGQDH